MATQVARHFTATSRVPHHDRVLKIEVLKQRRETVRGRVHFVAVPRLVGASMPPPVVRDDAIATLPEKQHLPVPVVRGQWPAMGKHDRLSFAPILVINLRAVFSCDCCHKISSTFCPL